MNNQRNPQRIEREKFRKRKSSLMRKVNEISYLCQADIYLVMYRKGKYYTYSSTTRPAWPPNEETIVSNRA